MSQVRTHYMDVDMYEEVDPEFFITFSNTVRYYGAFLFIYLHSLTFLFEKGEGILLRNLSHM